MRTSVWAVMLAIPCALASSSARADEAVAECASAYVQAQLQQKDGKYLEAAQTALSCSKRTCGDSLSGECAKLYDVIQSATPTVVFAPRDGDQNDLPNVRVQVDGKLVLDKIDGSPVALDPGVHIIRFESSGLPVVEKPYTLRAGEKMRLISEVLGRKRAAPRADTMEGRTAAPPPPSVSPKTLRIAGGVMAGLGVVAGVGFGLLYAAGVKDYNSLLASCSPHCTQDQVDPGKEKVTFSYVSLGVGIAALATSAALFAVSTGKRDTAAVLQIVPQPSGGEARLTMRF